MALLLGAALLAGCAGVSDRVVLLPQPDGAPSAVRVSAGAQAIRLEQPYAAVERDGGTLRPMQRDAAWVDARYGALLQQLPPRPQRFVLRFASNGSTLTAEAAPVLAQLRALLADQPAPELIVTGYTDRVGTDESNDRLSLQRAETVRDWLVAAGVRADAISVVGRGERDPEVPTADGVAEPRNRRVEVRVR